MELYRVLEESWKRIVRIILGLGVQDLGVRSLEVEAVSFMAQNLVSKLR